MRELYLEPREEGTQRRSGKLTGRPLRTECQLFAEPVTDHPIPLLSGAREHRTAWQALVFVGPFARWLGDG